MPSTLNLDALQIFCRQVSSLVKSGLPLAPGLRAIAGGSGSERLRQAVENLAAECHRGARLSDAMAARPEVFPEVYVRIIRAGEEAGNLNLVLEQLAVHAARSARLREAIRSALLYPKTVLAVAILILSGVYAFVVRGIDQVLLDGLSSPWHETPRLTVAAFGAANFLASNLWAPIAAVALVLFGVPVARRLAAQCPPLRRIWDQTAMRVPLVGEVHWLGEMARVCRITGVATQAGIPMPVALRLASETAERAVIAQELDETAEAVERGEKLADALKRFQSAPSLLVWALATSEEKGALSDELQRFASQYEMRAEASAGRIAPAFEGVLIPLIGLFVAATIASIFVPIYRTVFELLM